MYAKTLDEYVVEGINDNKIILTKAIPKFEMDAFLEHFRPIPN